MLEVFIFISIVISFFVYSFFNGIDPLLKKQVQLPCKICGTLLSPTWPREIVCDNCFILAMGFKNGIEGARDHLQKIDFYSNSKEKNNNTPYDN